MPASAPERNRLRDSIPAGLYAMACPKEVTDIALFRDTQRFTPVCAQTLGHKTSYSAF